MGRDWDGCDDMWCENAFFDDGETLDCSAGLIHQHSTYVNNIELFVSCWGESWGDVLLACEPVLIRQ